MSQLRAVFSGFAQSCTNPTTVPNPPLISSTCLIRATRSSGVPMVAAAASENAVLSTASSGVLNARAPGRCSVAVMYSLWCLNSPSLASARAFSRVSAICQLNSTRQFFRSTVVPCLAAAASANPHCVGSAFSPSLDSDPMEMMPMPCLPASVMPEGLICDATANGISSCNGSNCSAASCMVNQSVFAVTRSPRNSRRITPIASSCRSRSSIGSTPSVCASDASAPGPDPKIARPPVMWSSCTMRCATLNGW